MGSKIYGAIQRSTPWGGSWQFLSLENILLWEEPQAVPHLRDRPLSSGSITKLFLFDTNAAVKLGEDFMDHTAVDIGQPKVTTGVAECETPVIKS